MKQTYFSDAVRAARLDKGFSQSDLARAAGVSKQYVSLIEGGSRRPPRRPVASALCLALDIDLDAFTRAIEEWSTTRDAATTPTD
jgi:transcriptional regulator with XRE-family HTH domain